MPPIAALLVCDSRDALMLCLCFALAQLSHLRCCIASSKAKCRCSCCHLPHTVSPLPSLASRCFVYAGDRVGCGICCSLVHASCPQQRGVRFSHRARDLSGQLPVKPHFQQARCRCWFYAHPNHACNHRAIVSRQHRRYQQPCCHACAPTPAAWPEVEKRIQASADGQGSVHSRRQF